MRAWSGTRTCTVSDGASLTSEGSNLDTYGCPMQQHAYMHSNKITNTWGYDLVCVHMRSCTMSSDVMHRFFQNSYDREVMTFDGDDQHVQNVEGAAVSVSADGLNITLNCVPGRSAPVGGAATTASGMGAGQVRRIVAIYRQAALTGNESCFDTFTLDTAFAGPLDNSTHFQFLPFRGENIFENLEYEDVGVFQVRTNISTVGSIDTVLTTSRLLLRMLNSSTASRTRISSLVLCTPGRRAYKAGAQISNPSILALYF